MARKRKPEDIMSLWDKINEHPDFLGGSIYIREDLVEWAFDPEWERETPITDEERASITDEMYREASRITQNYFDSRGYSWNEALDDCIGPGDALYPLKQQHEEDDNEEDDNDATV